MNVDVNSNYAYKKYINSIVNRSSRYLNSIAQSWFFIKTQVTIFNNTGVQNGPWNLVLIHRYNRTQYGEDIMMADPLCVDLADIDQYLIIGIELKL